MSLLAHDSTPGMVASILCCSFFSVESMANILSALLSITLSTLEAIGTSARLDPTRSACSTRSCIIVPIVAASFASPHVVCTCCCNTDCRAQPILLPIVVALIKYAGKRIIITPPSSVTSTMSFAMSSSRATPGKQYKIRESPSETRVSRQQPFSTTVFFSPLAFVRTRDSTQPIRGDATLSTNQVPRISVSASASSLANSNAFCNSALQSSIKPSSILTRAVADCVRAQAATAADFLGDFLGEVAVDGVPDSTRLSRAFSAISTAAANKSSSSSPSSRVISLSEGTALLACVVVAEADFSILARFSASVTASMSA